MARSKRSTSPRKHIGRVSLYPHHGAWWIYYRDAGRPVRRKAAEDRNAAEQIAAQINAQLTSGAPTLLAFTPITVPDLRKEFLDFHEHVLRSSISTVRRYRAATQHLEDHVVKQLRPLQAHELKADAFATYLRKIEVAPNGHVNCRRRKLHGTGIRFILETCRSLYGFALKRRHLPPYTENPFSVLPLDRLKVDDDKVELADAVEELDRHFGELKRAARERLGSLYNDADYPETLRGLFAVSYDFPAIEPPDYLVGLSPQLYAQEQARVTARFEEAVQLAEEAFFAEFARLVAHLTERVTGANDDGTPKVFRDSAVGNLVAFFDRFKQLNVRSNAQLDALVAEAQRVVRGVEPQHLRDSDALRRRVAQEMARVQSSLDDLVVERPRRRLLRGATAPEAS